MKRKARILKTGGRDVYGNSEQASTVMKISYRDNLWEGIRLGAVADLISPVHTLLLCICACSVCVLHHCIKNTPTQPASKVSH